MTALSDDRIRDYRDDLPRQFTKPVIASDIIFKASMCGKDSSGDVGPCGVAGIGDCIGVSMHRVDNSTGAAGAKEVRLETGVFSFADDGATTEADLPATMYAVDDQTVSLDSVGTRKVAGLGIALDGTGKVLLLIGPLVVKDTVDAGAKIAAMGLATLVAGTVTVTTPNVRADSVVLCMPKGVSGSTDFSYLDTDTLTVGVSFTIEAKTIAHAADADAVGDVMWALINP